MIVNNKGLAEFYQRVVDTWGETAQLDMVIEEMAELTQAICKAKRNGISDHRENITEEMVDVLIMLEQLEVMLSSHYPSEFDFSDAYADNRQKKMDRLRNMLLEGYDVE